ncbi:MAG: hypothetical protein OXJ64_02725 [Boseongicola sp.]|nr:hypothetical protein [Boseongicola sp.]
MSRQLNRVRQENVFKMVIRRFVGQEARRRKVGVHVPVIAGRSHVDRNLRVEAIRQVAVYRIGRRIGQFVRIMVTHDAPSAAIKAVFPHVQLVRPLSRTTQAFDAMFEPHRPDAWIFSHWHRSASAVVDGTRFQCLGELRSCTLSWCGPGGTVCLSAGSEHV